MVPINYNGEFTFQSDIIGAGEAGDMGFTDNFLNMMGGVSIHYQHSTVLQL